MNEQSLKLYGYHCWANRKLLDHLKQLPPETVRQPLQSVFPTILDALLHVYRVDNVFLRVMNGEDMATVLQRIEQMKGNGLEQIEVSFEELSVQYLAFIEGRDMEGTKEYAHPLHGVMKARYSDLVQHIVNHGTYHRGNVTAMLRQLGHAGVPTDYVFYAPAFEYSQ